MIQKVTNPSSAAAIILLDQSRQKVLWARRNPKLKFLGGFHGFCGGKVDKSDETINVKNCSDQAFAAHISCGVRELFEETGTLLVRNGDKLTKGQRVSLHDDLVSNRSTFGEILNDWGLIVDGSDFFYAGIWTTPEFSRIRFATRFFVAVCPQKQSPYDATDEMTNVQFVDPSDALDLWSKSRVLIAPPVLYGLRGAANETSEQKLAEHLRQFSEENEGRVYHIELNSRLICLPLRTKTLPPATHTNCFIIGRKRFVVVDAASPDVSELEKLYRVIDDLIETGGKCQAIVVSHAHKDHYGGEALLKEYIKERFEVDVPIAAHSATADKLKGVVNVEALVRDKETYELKDSESNTFPLDMFNMPGHAPGHLCFYDREFGFLLPSDNVIDQSTVVIAPPEGKMSDYLSSLESMRDLPGLNFLCGSHGAAISEGRGRIQEYIDHRLEREDQILKLASEGFETEEIVREVYTNLVPLLIPLARKNVEAHLEKLRNDEKI